MTDERSHLFTAGELRQMVIDALERAQAQPATVLKVAGWTDDELVAEYVRQLEEDDHGLVFSVLGTSILLRTP